MTSRDQFEVATTGVGPSAAIWLRRMAALGFAGAAIIAIAGLLGYVPGMRLLGSIRPDYVPMALSTAICFLVISMTLFLHTRKHRQGAGLVVMIVLVTVVIVFTLLEVVGRLIGRDLNFEEGLVAGMGTVGSIPIGVMSPATGAAFLIAGLGTLLLLLSRSSRLRAWAYGLGVVTMLIGATVLLAYLYGTPLMYTGSAVPMAATTATAFVFLGALLVAAVGPEIFKLSLMSGDTTSVRLYRAFIPLVVTVVLIQNILIRFLSARHLINDALLLAILAFVVVVITAFVAARMAQSIGKSIDELNGNLEQSNLALSESEAKLREAQEIARLGRWELDLSTNRLTWSDGIFDLFEVDQKSFVASYEAFIGFIYPDDRAIVDQAYRESLENKLPYEIEHRILMKDGRIKWVNEICRTEYDNAGKPLRSIGTVQDITERKQAEQRLQTSEQRFRSFFDKGPVGYLTFDAEGCVIEINSTILTMLGFDRDEVVGKQFGDFMVPQAADAFRKGFPVLRAVGQLHSDFEIVRKNGSKRFVAFEGRISHDAEGGSEQTHCILTDITERKNAENALQLQSRFQGLLMNMSTTFINLPLEEVESAISVSISRIGEFVGALRLFVFAYDFDKQIATATHEWCSEGAEPQAINYQAIPLAAVPDWDVEAHLRGEPIWITDVLALPPGALRNMEERSGSGSILAVPLMSFGECIGFVALTWAQQHQAYTEEENRILMVFAQMLVNIQLRKQAEQTLQQANAELKASNDYLSRFNSAATDRELRMIELKREINALCIKLGQPEPYSVDFADSTPPDGPSEGPESGEPS